MGIEKIRQAHLAVCLSVSHYERMQSDRYFVWAEDGASDLIAGGRHCERVMSGTTDLFTKIDGDPWARQLEDSFNSHGIAWGLNSVQYEEDTGFIHYEWAWEVTDG